MGEWLSPQSLMAVAALLTALGTSIAQIWREKRSAPIDKESAQIATFSSISSANKNAVDSFIQLAKEQRQELNRKDAELEEEHKKVSIWEGWHRNLRIKWNDIRKFNTPPHAPDYDKVDS